VTPGVVVADAGYGIDTGFRSGVSALGLRYVVGIQSSTSLWPPGTGPLPPRVWGGRGRPPSSVRRNPDHKPVSAKDLAQTLADDAWRVVTWREGTNAPLTSRFAAVRLRPAHRDYSRPTPRPEEWFLVEWPQDEAEPTKYWFSTLPEDTALADLVDQAKRRSRVGWSGSIVPDSGKGVQPWGTRLGPDEPNRAMFRRAQSGRSARC
jgi:SRSO17 transposase